MSQIALAGQVGEGESLGLSLIRANFCTDSWQEKTEEQEMCSKQHRLLRLPRLDYFEEENMEVELAQPLPTC